MWRDWDDNGCVAEHSGAVGARNDAAIPFMRHPRSHYAAQLGRDVRVACRNSCTSNASRADHHVAIIMIMITIESVPA